MRQGANRSNNGDAATGATAVPPIRTVGVIGAGRMGQPIIGHMARKGFTVVVHDIDAGKREAVVQLGAAWAESVALARHGTRLVWSPTTGVRD